MKYLSLLALSCTVLTLAACGASTLGPTAGSSAALDLHANVTTPTPGAAATLSSDWPSDVPAYPSAAVQFSGMTSQGASAIFTTSDTADQVAAFYSTNLKTQGWTVDATMQAAGMTAVTAKKGERQVGVTMAANEGLTTITVGVANQN